MSFQNINASELKQFNFSPPIAYRKILNFDQEVRLKITTAQFFVHEKKNINQNAQFPFLVKLEVPDTTELEALKVAIETAVGHNVDLLCENILYVNLKQELYEALKKVSTGSVITFEIRLRHLVYFSATPRIKFVIDAFNVVPRITEKPKQKVTKKSKLQRQHAVYPETQPADPGMIDDFLASLREETN